MILPRAVREATAAGVGPGKSHRKQFWFVLLVSLPVWWLLIYLNSSGLLGRNYELVSVVNSYAISVDSRENFDHLHVAREGYNNETRTHVLRSTEYLGVVEEDFPVAVREINVTESEKGSINNGTENGETSFPEDEDHDNQIIPEEDSTKKDEGHSVNGTEQVDSISNLKNRTAKQSSSENGGQRIESQIDPCLGRYIYVHDLPPRFNRDILEDCRSLNKWSNMCKYVSNMGLGPKIANSERAFSNTGWFATHQFSLELIFHNRMKQYKCLTKDSSRASAIFVPFYAGLDVGRHLWGSNTSMRDSTSMDLAKWLASRPEWKSMGGRDHFLVAGRISWDFGRISDEDSSWGNKLLILRESKNMTILVIESSPWSKNDFAIPYPTYFHPSSDREVFQWQNRMRKQKRRVLFSFVGGARPNLKGSIRGEIIEQCQASRRKCKLLGCNPASNKCQNPVNVMKTFQSSVFCLQPSGDSYTRRSMFDSILAGCIPVFFHPASAYVQYLWHLPKNYTKYSVFISENDVKEGKVGIEQVLRRIRREEVQAMREEVIRMIPRMVYADPRSTLQSLEDAFDLTMKGVLGRVERLRKEMKEGRDSSGEYAEGESWKYELCGNVRAHEWDPFFSKPNRSPSW
ncbi:xyloglucan galactosyltransferase KATAMARI1 homolog [Malania oleifera]|uniref:xyloglucan galactosyltransferase KATAMARI1 homolog n=1 Tax=Malania oleifera TaxID=397392 RepID=UPI0025AECC88|nr:xyloglucan galactosyltransferase KATAMARI1 homolog [Malania oleifera]